MECSARHWQHEPCAHGLTPEGDFRRVRATAVGRRQDLSRLGRELRRCIIIDNSPASYIFQPENALPISSWLDNPNDLELLDLVPPLTELTKAYDVTEYLRML